MKKSAEQKLQTVPGGGGSSRPLSRKELEEQKKKEEEEAAAHVFQEFVETFHEAPCSSFKTWVKAGTYDAGARKEDTTERGKLYKPQMRSSDALDKISSVDRVQEYARMLTSKVDQKPLKKKDKDKRKSNLELFKEELRQIQEEREERHKYKDALRGAMTESTKVESANSVKDEMIDPIDYSGTRTTNLYLANLNPKVTTSQLMEIFGRFGPLASIKIMWPRSEEQIARGRNCGFVAYMCRRDGERALRSLNGKEVMQYEMKIGWGKAVVIPPHPIYIPPTMQQPSVPPPPSGLPFNAQPPAHLFNKISRLMPVETLSADSEEKKEFDKILMQSVVKVVVPTERATLMLIHRMVEFVIREGPMFEAMIMNKEIDNPSYRFLFENKSPSHVYYRWKLFSLLQGDNLKQWSSKDFRMFKGGSVWRPPSLNAYAEGMPEDLIYEDEIKDTKGSLSKTQRERLEDLIRHITPERARVGEAMVFCMEHAEAAEEIAECISESLSIATTAVHKKIARVYLISDILHNCGIKLTNASYYRKAFETRLIIIMQDLYASRQKLESRLQSEGFRVRVNQVLHAWDDWAIYPKEYLSKLHKAFSGIEIKEDEPPLEMECLDDEGEGDGDGDDGEEGGPLDGAALLKAAKGLHRQGRHSPPTRQLFTPLLTEDIDGIPLDDDIDGTPMIDDDDRPSAITSMSLSVTPGFVPSRWESVEPDQVEAGAVTSQRWNHLPAASPPRLTPPHNSNFSSQSPPSPENNDSNEVTDERRTLLRNVELQAMQYQDELEGGQRQLKSGWTVLQQVQHYRRKLLKKAEKEAKEKEDSINDSPGKIREKKMYKEKERDKDSTRGRSVSSDDDYISSNSSSKKSKRSREASTSPQSKRSRHRSRSPGGRNKSVRHMSNKRTSSPSPPPRSARMSSPTSPSHHSRHSDSSRKHKHKHKY